MKKQLLSCRAYSCSQRKDEILSGNRLSYLVVGDSTVERINNGGPCGGYEGWVEQLEL